MKHTHARRLGRMLKAAREKKGLSLRDVEQLTGISFSWISRTELGHYSRPAPDRMTKLAEVLAIDAHVLDELTSGDIAGLLPQPRTYLRAKYQLSAEEIARVEQVIAQVRQERAAKNQAGM